MLILTLTLTKVKLFKVIPRELNTLSDLMCDALCTDELLLPAGASATIKTTRRLIFSLCSVSHRRLTAAIVVAATMGEGGDTTLTQSRCPSWRLYRE